MGIKLKLNLQIENVNRYFISNNTTFRPKHPGVPDGSDGSDGTMYPLTEIYMLSVALHNRAPGSAGDNPGSIW
jgi:hypothetical protein